VEEIVQGRSLRLIRPNSRRALRKQRKRFALRARELFYAAGESIEEGQALDEAVRPACSAEHITKLTMVYRIAVRLPSRMLKNYS
jgi:hypothetical protein